MPPPSMPLPCWWGARDPHSRPGRRRQVAIGARTHPGRRNRPAGFQPTHRRRPRSRGGDPRATDRSRTGEPCRADGDPRPRNLPPALRADGRGAPRGRPRNGGGTYARAAATETDIEGVRLPRLAVAPGSDAFRLCCRPTLDKSPPDRSSASSWAAHFLAPLGAGTSRRCEGNHFSECPNQKPPPRPGGTARCCAATSRKGPCARPWDGDD